MDIKQIWIMVFIALIVAIVVSLVTSAVNPSLAPRTSLSSAPINANSCNADGVCEANAVIAQGAEISNLAVLNTLNTEDISSNVDLRIASINGDMLLEADDVSGGTDGLSTLFTDYLKSAFISRPLRINDFGGQTEILSNVTISDGDSKLRVISLKASGTNSTNAYVCVNNKGVLFRSQTPCV